MSEESSNTKGWFVVIGLLVIVNVVLIVVVVGAATTSFAAVRLAEANKGVELEKMNNRKNSSGP